MGGRTGYSAATGVLMLVLTWFGVIGLMMAIIPAVALLPILLYIGMLIGAQAFQESPHKHAPAVVLAIVPTIAAWGTTQINNALGAAGTNAGAVGMDKLANNGVLYEGLHILGSGATLAGIILGSIAVMIIDKKLEKAAYFALAGALLTFFGLIHAEAIGIMRTPGVAASYLMVAVFLYACSRKESAVAQRDVGEPVALTA
jgi:AGZA family xanthine/uracil permease-like MFS transporter